MADPGSLVRLATVDNTVDGEIGGLRFVATAERAEDESRWWRSYQLP